MTKCAWPVVLFVASVLVVPARAAASTITFDDVAAGNCGGYLTGTVSGGFLFSSQHHHVCNSVSGASITNNGTNHLAHDFNTGVTMSAVGGAAFSLTAFDLSELFVLANFAPYLEVSGSLSGGGSVTTPRIALDGVRDGPGGVPDFQQVLLSGFSNVTSVTFIGYSAAFGGAPVSNFSLDNLVVGEATAVPDAGSAAIMLLGAMSVLGVARRKRGPRRFGTLSQDSGTIGN